MGSIGEQLIARNGYRNLKAQTLYFYLGGNAIRDDVMLSCFSDCGRKGFLEFIPRSLFEDALIEGQIETAVKQRTLPVWLDPLSGDSQSTSKPYSLEAYKEKHKARVKATMDRYEPIFGHLDWLFDQDDPLREIRKIARANNLQVTRSATHTLVYVSFNRSKWALLPRALHSGRDKAPPEGDLKKRGPKPGAGKIGGYSKTQEMEDLVLKGYREVKGGGLFQPEIYEYCLLNKFGCRARRLNEKHFEMFHPDGHPFPSESQFRNILAQHIGRDQLRVDRNGEQKVRNRRPSKGPFTAEVANLLERVEGDGYFLKEVPKGERDGNPMPKMCVVRLRDICSGEIVGIGFSIGGEKAAAYRMAIFCMCVSKVYFCSLFGVKIGTEDWPSIGIPQWLSFDRGPGAMQELMEELESAVIFRDIAPTYAGQSKAPTEASHPRTPVRGGQPQYVISDLTYTQLAVREIERTVRDNCKMNVEARLTPDMKKARVPGTPNGIWNYLNGRFRNLGKQVDRDLAIRQLLMPVKVKAYGHGVELHGMRYDSPSLRAHDVCQRATRGMFELQAYVLPLSVRHIWIEYQGFLIECDAQLPIRDDDRQLYVSVVELEEIAEIRAESARLDKDSRSAASIYFAQQFQDHTGLDWNAGRTKTGKVVRDREEFSDTNGAQA